MVGAQIGARYLGGNRVEDFNGSIDDVRIYDRALFAEEIQQLYGEGLGDRAFNPNPAYGTTGVDPNVVLSWSPGVYAASHDVYFGTSWGEVNDADTSTTGIYRSNQPLDANSYSPPEDLESHTTYYWRIDEVNDPNMWKGGVWSFTTWTSYEGSGTAEDPYLIYDANDMQAIGADPNYWDAHFKLMADIDLGGYTGTGFNIIGNFTGVFDGNENTISNFSYSSSGIDRIGLFRRVGAGAEIKDLGLVNPNVDAGTGWEVGALVARNGGTVTGCYVEGGSVTGNKYFIGGLVGLNDGGVVYDCNSSVTISGIGEDVGGLVGLNYGQIKRSHATGNITGRSAYRGGLVGINAGIITESYATGVVSGVDYLGGLVAENSYGEISRCYATGGIDSVWYVYPIGTVKADHIGGLVGYNDRGIISNCYTEVNLNGGSWVGGLVGESEYGEIYYCYAIGTVASGYTNTHGTPVGGVYVGGLIGLCTGGKVKDSYCTGSVSGRFRLGGLVGKNTGAAQRCYSVGSVSGTEGEVGGLVGVNSGTFEACFWDVNTSGEPNSNGGTGLTTAEMRTKSTFTDAGWDFNTPIWMIAEGLDYPRLWWENAAPVACIVGGDRVVEAGSGCEARVILDGTCSSDADSTEGTNDDINDFDWYEVIDPCDPNSDIFLGSGEIIECNLPLGEHTIILEVIDKAGAFDSNEVTIIVEDTTPPEFSLSVEPDVLWPANHKMVLITPSWEISDNCDELPEVTLVSITMNEEDDAKGDGHTSDDIQVNDKGIWLRVERSGKRACRVYTITYRAVDDSGNITLGGTTVTVPHDKRRAK